MQVVRVEYSYHGFMGKRQDSQADILIDDTVNPALEAEVALEKRFGEGRVVIHQIWTPKEALELPLVLDFFYA